MDCGQEAGRDGAVRAEGTIRPLTEVNGLPRAAFALWDMREQAVELRRTDYSETGVDDSVVRLYNRLVERMQAQGVARKHHLLPSNLRRRITRSSLGVRMRAETPATRG